MEGLPMGPCPGVLEGAVVGGEGKSLALIDPLSPPTIIKRRVKTIKTVKTIKQTIFVIKKSVESKRIIGIKTEEI
jgi:hypothetical protein